MLKCRKFCLFFHHKSLKNTYTFYLGITFILTNKVFYRTFENVFNELQVKIIIWLEEIIKIKNNLK